MKPNTDYRPDGNFYIERKCWDCGQTFYVHALQNASTNPFEERCGSCEQQIWELEQLYGKYADDQQTSQ